MPNPRLIKLDSEVVKEGKLGLEPTNTPKHPVFVAHKAPKPNTSKDRNSKKWVYKSNEVCQQYLTKMTAYISQGMQLRIPTQNELTEGLLTDVVVSEHYAFMTNQAFKSRLVFTDKEEVVGKMSSFIDGLQTMADQLNSPSYHDSSVLFTDVVKFIKNPPHGTRSQALTSFAQCCVIINRLGVKDLHFNNIGYSAAGNFVLFDLEHGLDFKQVVTTIGYSAFTRSGTKSFKTITQQPEAMTFQSLDKYSADLFRQELSDCYPEFQHQVFRQLLKEILIPERWLQELTHHHSSPALAQHADKLAKEIYSSQIRLRDELLANEDFKKYLLTASQADIEGIIAEFAQAQAVHKHYFTDDTNYFIDHVRNMYMTTLQDAQDKVTVSQFSKYLPDESAQEKSAMLRLLTRFMTLIAPLESQPPISKQERDQLLTDGCHNLLRLRHHSYFDITSGVGPKIIATIKRSPNFCYQMLLAALYTHSEQVWKALLPAAVQHLISTVGIDQPDQSGRSLLQHVLMAGETQALGYLLQHGARVDRVNPLSRPIAFELAHGPSLGTSAYLLAYSEEVMQQLNRAQTMPYLGTTCQEMLELEIAQRQKFTQRFESSLENGNGFSFSNLDDIRRFTAMRRRPLNTGSLLFPHGRWERSSAHQAEEQFARDLIQEASKHKP